MIPSSFYRDREKAKLQTRALRAMRQEVNPETGLPYIPARVDTWLGGYRGLFPDARSNQTIYDQGRKLAPFRRRYGDRTMASITAIEVQDWALKHPHQVRELKRAWDYAVLMRVVPLNVWKLIVPAPRTKEKRRAPTEDELAVIFAGIEEHGWEVFGRMCRVAMHTGARQGGLLQVRRCDVDLNHGRMRLTEKGNKTRTVALLGGSKDALLEQFALRERHGWQGPQLSLQPGKPSPLVFVTEVLPHRRMAAVKLQQYFAQVRGDFPHGFHTLRNYAAQWMREAGIDPLDIALQLGHTDAEGRPRDYLVQRVYARPPAPDPETVLARIEAALSPEATR